MIETVALFMTLFFVAYKWEITFEDKIGKMAKKLSGSDYVVIDGAQEGGSAYVCVYKVGRKKNGGTKTSIIDEQ